MKKIQKIISLEALTSKVPSVWPAYKDGTTPYFFDEDSLKARQYKYTSNYGMIPLNIKYNGIIMSFERLSNRYAFMKNYNHLLKYEGHCGLSYNNAVDFYDNESKSKYSDDLPYGNNRDVYEELDKTYNDYGGKDFYEWICTNIIPTYEISSDYKDYWNRETLYYPDVIKWIAWFKDKTFYEEFKDECKSSPNCCECEEYFNRGGETELEKMIDWYEGVQHSLSEIKNMDTSEFVPHLDDKIELSNSLNDMGQFSVLSPNLEMGKEYRTIETQEGSEKTIINYENGNTHTGTTVINDNESLILVNGNGFCYSASYMEMLLKDDDWSNYTEYYIKDNPNDFVSSAYKYYAFDEDNVMYTGNSAPSVEEAMKTSNSYDITQINSVLINGVLYNLEEHEYGDYTNQLGVTKRYFVERDENTNTPYVVMDGKTIYASSYLHPTNGFCYYFSFFKSENYVQQEACHSDGNPLDINQYKIFGREKSKNPSDLITKLNYGGGLYSASTFNTIAIGNTEYTSVTVIAYVIDGINYPLITGYTNDIEGNPMYLVNNITDVFDSNLMQIDNAKIKNNKVCINKYNQDIKIYKVNELVGTTSSKLSSLKANNTLVDDIGNKIDGLYNDTCKKLNDLGANGYYAQPPINTILEPSYQIGNVSLLGRLKNLTHDEPNDESYCIGNILTDMTFYYKDVNGNIINDTKVSCSNDISSLSAINTSTETKKTLTNIVFDDELYCDITYYIGATLKKENNKLTLAYNPNTTSNNYNYGVQYNETVRFVKKQVFYYLTKENENVVPTEIYNPTNTNVKYPIYIYDIEQDVETVKSETYDTEYSTPLAKFKTEINLLNYIDSNLKSTFSEYEDMDAYEGVKVSPVYKEEYKIGLSSMENVDTDIYIDRGINSAFEKHLKLGEVTSMEALENYGNNFFKIMEN